MRIADMTSATQLIQSINLQSSNMSSLEQQLSTGYKVNQPSDDPAAAGQIMNTNDYIADINQNISNVNAAEAFAQAASTSLSNSTTIISNVQQLAVQGANGTESASDLQALGAQVNEDLESLVQNANSQFGSSYMFSGTATNTAPIAVTRDAQGNIQSVTYQGSDNEMEIPISQGSTAPVSVTANQAYVNSGLLGAVTQLRNDLNNTQGLSSQDQQQALSNDLNTLNTAQTAFLAQAAEVGSYQSQFTSLGQQLQTTLTQAQTIVASYQDADAAQVSVQLQTAQTVYQAVISAASQLLQQKDIFSYL